MRVVDAYNISPQNIRPGDVMMFVVKAMVMHDGSYRLYRCPYRGGDIPDGLRIYDHAEEVCEAVFPSLSSVSKPDKM